MFTHANTIEDAMKELVKIKNDQVKFGGPKYTYNEIAGLIVHAQLDTHLLSPGYDEYKNQLKFVDEVVDKILNYLHSIGISSEYSKRSRSVIANLSDFR